MRRTADRVDTQMRSFRSTLKGSSVWKARDALLVAIGPAEGNDTVVRSAARLAVALDAPWHAVYVETPELQRLPEAHRRKILATLGLAKELGAQTATIGAPDVARALVHYARTHNLGKLVVGRAPTRRRLADRWRQSLADRASAIASDLDVVVVTRDEARPAAASESEAEREPLAWRGYAGALGLCIVVTVVTTPLSHIFDLANIVMLFMLAVVVVALLFGRGPAVLAAVVNVLAFDFFFVPPRLSLAVSDVQYLITFAVMLVVGLAVGQLTARLHYQARFAS